MKPQLRTDSETYSLIVVRRQATEVLWLTNKFGWSLPQVDILPTERVAEGLTSEARARWALSAYCLFIPRFVTSAADTKRMNFAVLECLDDSNPLPAESRWMPRTADVSWRLDDECEYSGVIESLEELDVHADEPRTGPLAKPGWLHKLFEWARERIAEISLTLSGAFRQLNASPTFSLIRLETSGDAVWFKATGQPNVQELPITLCLARLFPRFLPTVVAVHSSWNGWLSLEVPGETLDKLSELSAWERAAGELAQLQISSIGEETELLGSSAKDLRLSRLRSNIDPFLEGMAEIMAAQEKKSPQALTGPELDVIAKRLKEACSILEDAGLPDTVGHLDFNPGNIVVSSGRCVFLDWAEGSVGNPLFTYEYLREHLRQCRVEGEVSGRITSAYLRPWRAFVSHEDLMIALRASPLLAVFAYAVAAQSRFSSVIGENPPEAGYLRSLTRRMYREAVQAVERSDRCLV